MSQDNVEVVHRAWASLTAGGWDALAEFWEADTVRDGKIVRGRE